MFTKKKIHNLSDVAIILNPDDNVAVAVKDIRKASLIRYSDGEILILNDIPACHRFSLQNIKSGFPVIQYGSVFGLSRGIKKGQIISEEYVAEIGSNYERRLKGIKMQKPLLIKSTRPKSASIHNRMFWGYKRKYGKVGTRNYYLVLPTSLCASDVAAKVAGSFDNSRRIHSSYKNVSGIVAAAHTEGCGCNDGEIIDRLLLTLKNTILNPNVGGVLVVDLGCEKTNYTVISKYFRDLKKHNKPIDYLSIQKAGGTGCAISKAKDIIVKRLKNVNSCSRELVSVSKLIAGTECGASDSFSGITANPLIGAAVDSIIQSGGSAILSETTEMIGAEHTLIKRMVSKTTVQKFVKGMLYYQTLARKLGVSIKGNFVPGNKKGGLVNLTLKSLGAVLKGGSTPIVDFLDYAELVKQKGLSIMNGPGNDLESMTGISASGANLILFSTGMGASEGNLISPVIKISTRTETFEKLKDDIDFNAGALIDSGISLQDLSLKLLDLIIKVASGKKTCSEKWKKRSFQIWSAGKLSL